MSIKDKLAQANKSKVVLHCFYLAFAVVAIYGFMTINTEISLNKAKINALMQYQTKLTHQLIESGVFDKDAAENLKK